MSELDKAIEVLNKYSEYMRKNAKFLATIEIVTSLDTVLAEVSKLEQLKVGMKRDLENLEKSYEIDSEFDDRESQLTNLSLTKYIKNILEIIGG